MSGVSLSTKGMICNGNNFGAGTGGVPAMSTITESPIINVVRIKTKVISKGLSLKEMSKIVFNVDKVLSSY